MTKLTRVFISRKKNSTSKATVTSVRTFVRSYVAVSKAKFAENLHFVMSSPD